MADKSVGELIAAQSVTPTDLFVLEQNGTAKKLTGQILENWLVSFANGHGGIQSIAKLSTSGLADTYRITLADTTTFDFVVNNGMGITGISKTSTSGLVDTYTISYNNGTTSKFTVTNGAKGDKGDNTYTWIKYASQEPTESSHSIGDIPDDWIGIYSGNASTAPTDWKQYKWFQIKGEKGNTGEAATLVNKSVTYQVSDSGTIIPSGSWGSSIPVVSQGKYLWTKTKLQFNTGDPIVSYSVTRMGMDGTGSVSSVAGVSPDATGNVTLTAADVGALPVSGGDMTGNITTGGDITTGGNIYTNRYFSFSGAYDSRDFTIFGLWADGKDHNLIQRYTDGLTMGVGWDGTAGYATVLNLRSRTVKVTNSSGTSTLSDERMKKDWKNLDGYDAFFDALNPRAFRYIDGSSGRYHLGFGAQSVEKALADSGLDNTDFGGLIKYAVPLESDDWRGYGEEYGLIYTEFVALLTDQVQKLKAEVRALRQEVQDLKNQIGG